MSNEEYYESLDEQTQAQIDARTYEMTEEIKDRAMEWKSSTTALSYYIQSLALLEHRISVLENKPAVNTISQKN